jgi:hypothetical protein
MKTSIFGRSLVLVLILGLHGTCRAPGQEHRAPGLPRNMQFSEADWKNIVERMKDYPMPISKPAMNVVLVRASNRPARLFNDSWRHDTQDRPYFPSAPIRFLLKGKNDDRAAIGIVTGPDATHQLIETISTACRILSGARPSTIRGGVACLKIQGASFIANYVSAEKAPNTVIYSVNNVRIRIHSVKQLATFPSDDDLTDLAQKFNNLFQDTADLDTKQPKEGELQLGVVERAEDSATINWSATGSLEGHWIRIDTKAGELAIIGEEPGRVALSKIPDEGTTLSCYAISPDGKEWYKTSIQIPGREGE